VPKSILLRYTKKDLRSLRNILTEANPYGTSMSFLDFLDNRLIFLLRVLVFFISRPDKKSNLIPTEDNIILCLKVPLEEVPLYLNSKNEMVSIIMKWRLTL
jgi:hypothetical protein